MSDKKEYNLRSKSEEEHMLIRDNLESGETEFSGGSTGTEEIASSGGSSEADQTTQVSEPANAEKSELQALKELILSLHEQTKNSQVDILNAQQNLRTDIVKDLDARIEHMRQGLKTDLQASLDTQISEVHDSVNDKICQLREEQQLAQDKLGGQMTDLEDKLTKTQQTCTDEVKAVGRTVQRIREDVEKRMDSLEQGTGSSDIENQLKELQAEVKRNKDRPIRIVGGCRSSDEVPRYVRFAGNPMEFLRRLDDYLNRSELNEWCERRTVIEKSLDGEANEWWMVIQAGVDSMDAFRLKFRNKFWGDRVQNAHKEKLRTGKFAKGGKLTATEYLTKNVLLAKNLEPAMSESEIVSHMVKHFGKNVETARFNRNVTDFEGLEELLAEWENSETEEKKLGRAPLVGETRVPRPNLEFQRAPWRPDWRRENPQGENNRFRRPVWQEGNRPWRRDNVYEPPKQTKDEFKGPSPVVNNPIENKGKN